MALNVLSCIILTKSRAILQYFQPIQIFSRLNPQYEYIWQFELDARYTGHLYHFLEQAAAFAKKQPRKYMWERNSYFYIPAVHGDWEQFMDNVDRSMGTQEGIWGPRPAIGINVEDEAPEVPTSDNQDNLWEWGIGEEADVITWMPQFNPKNTGWPFRDRIFNFLQGTRTPVRASPVAMSRVSARLLRLMHKDKTRGGFGLASEMSPVSWALFYGLKSVQVPMPIYHELKWDPVELNRRANPGKPGGINAGKKSIWSWQMHDDIMLKLSYMFSSDFAGKLYRAWLGLDDAVEVGFLSNRLVCMTLLTVTSGRRTIVASVYPLCSYIQSRRLSKGDCSGMAFIVFPVTSCQIRFLDFGDL